MPSFPWCALLAAFLLGATHASAAASGHRSDASDALGAPVVAQGEGRDQPTEEMTVTAERPLSPRERRRIYRDLARGKRLFAKRKVDQAFPYLLDAAQRGFKDSQVRVGYVYLRGLGEVERDSEQAIGWLGVASNGRTSPSIRNYFNDIWKRIPDRHVPYFQEVVEEYRSKYGRNATGVVCEMKRPLDSHVKQLGCFFEEDLHDDVRESLSEREARAETQRLVEERWREAVSVMDELRRSGVAQ